MFSFATAVLVTAVIVTFCLAVTVVLENFTLLSVGAAVTVIVAALAAVAKPLSSTALKFRLRAPAPLKA